MQERVTFGCILLQPWYTVEFSLTLFANMVQNVLQAAQNLENTTCAMISHD